jgi:hypothetical protein
LSTNGLTGLGVTFVVSGTSTVGSCGLSSVTSAFCLGSGYDYDTVELAAPSSGSSAGLPVIGPQSLSYTGAAAFANGASNTQVSGAFHLPNGQIYMSGAATKPAPGLGVGSSCTTIEFALLAPTFLGLVFGTIEYGGLLWTEQGGPLNPIRGPTRNMMTRSAPDGPGLGRSWPTTLSRYRCPERRPWTHLPPTGSRPRRADLGNRREPPPGPAAKRPINRCLLQRAETGLSP